MSGRIAGIMVWLLAMLSASAQAQTVVEYLHTDALGSVVAVTNASRTVLERREYEPYGSQLTPAVSNGPGYTGHMQDAATGLVYAQQRYYDVQIGVFLSVDPVTANSGTGANFNRYRYANNNPYSFTDPDGRCGTRIQGHTATGCTTIQVNPSNGGGASSDSVSSQQPSSTASGADKQIRLASLTRPSNTVEAGIQRAILRGDAGELRMLLGESNGILATNDLAIAQRALLAMEKLGANEARMLAQRYGVDFANRIGHVFGKAGHNLAALTEKFGSAERAFVQIQSSVDALSLPAGQFTTTVTVGGTNVTVTGIVQGGLARIGTAFFVP